MFIDNSISCHQTSTLHKHSHSMNTTNDEIIYGRTFVKLLCIPSFQQIVPAMGFDIVIICPAFEDICWVSDDM